MNFEERLNQWAGGGRGVLLAAVVALLAGLPGLLALPPLDRDEARFAQATAQMLETGDFVSIRFQETPRHKKPVGIYWLQAAAVAAVAHVEDRAIWAWRIPSLLGAMLAAAACAWGAGGFLKPGASLMAGAMLGAGFMLATEADIAATDGALCGVVTLMMAALLRLYLAGHRGSKAGAGVKLVFWFALALSVLIKGPIGPMILVLTVAALCLWDRQVSWLKSLGWGWGAVLVLAVVGPWALAITIATDGAFWGEAFRSDLAPKLAGAHEGHGAPPGFYALLAGLLLYPASLALPAGLITGWRDRMQPGVRFALCWLIPSWTLFELTPTKLIHYTLPLYGALALLMAAALAKPKAQGFGRFARLSGAGFSVLGALVFAAAGPVAMIRLHDSNGMIWAVAAGGLFLLAGGVSTVLLLRSDPWRALVFGGALALVGHAALAAGLAPSLQPLWLSSRVAQALLDARISPRDGVTPGPVTVAGYQEPSLVFLLGTDTELGDADDAAAAIAAGRPAVVEDRLSPRFLAALGRRGIVARPLGVVEGLDYSNNQQDVLRLYGPPTRVSRHKVTTP